MCQRMLIIAAAGAVLCTYRGKPHSVVSFDSRCEPTRDFNDLAQTNLLSFANSDKPGVLVNVGKGDNIATFEFTDAVPDDALIIEYVDPASDSADAPVLDEAA